MSRRCAGVGVGIPAARLREISAGAPAADAELTDVEFAVIASELKHDDHFAKAKRRKHRSVEGLFIVGMGLVAFFSLMCMALLMFSLMLHTRPF